MEKKGTYSLSGLLEATSVAELPISTSGMVKVNSKLELKTEKCLFRAKKCGGDQAARQEKKKVVITVPLYFFCPFLTKATMPHRHPKRAKGIHQIIMRELPKPDTPKSANSNPQSSLPPPIPLRIDHTGRRASV